MHPDRALAPFQYRRQAQRLPLLITCLLVLLAVATTGLLAWTGARPGNRAIAAGQERDGTRRDEERGARGRSKQNASRDPSTLTPRSSPLPRSYAAKPDIRKLSQHFLETNGRTAPWIFIPKDNIKSISTSENPGFVTIWEAGKGKDIKGILDQPIRINDYPLPWEFRLGLMQNSRATKGLSEEQINYAIGLNLALTFSDPATWPSDRTQLPPKTHSAQLFVVHLGNQGEIYRQGVPQVKRSPLNFYDHSPEVYLVYGRGDLAPNINGNWQMGYTWVGGDPVDSGSSLKTGGPASPFLRFRVGMLGPTVLQIGVGYGDTPGYRFRTVDVSRFGNITGIWEIGPIFSLDRWIPDVLAAELKLDQQPPWLESFRQRQKLMAPHDPTTEALAKKLAASFRVQPPDPQFQYYVDYAIFYGNGPENVEHLSDDFDVPGFLADQKYYIEGNGICETHSNPGYLTVTLFGDSAGWAMCPILQAGDVDLSGRHQPPFEIEIAFIPPEADRPWNLWWNVGLYDARGKMHSWQPGVKNMPGQGCRYFNQWVNDPARIGENPEVNPAFEPPLPQSILAHRPLYMLLQVPDPQHARVGFKANRQDRWTFSRPFAASKAFGKITKFAYPCVVSFQGAGGKGWGTGNYPAYQKFKIDYIHYRYARSE
jgi:hypothetical protein